MTAEPLTPAQITGRMTAALATITSLWPDMLTPPSRSNHGGTAPILSDDDVDAITATYKTGDGDGGVNVGLVPLSDIEANSFDLNIGRYIQTETKAEADVDAAIASLREAQERMDAARAALDLRLKEAGFDA